MGREEKGKEAGGKGRERKKGKGKGKDRRSVPANKNLSLHPCKTII